jgi:hypothetical protein
LTDSFELPHTTIFASHPTPEFSTPWGLVQHLPGYHSYTFPQIFGSISDFIQSYHSNPCHSEEIHFLQYLNQQFQDFEDWFKKEEQQAVKDKWTLQDIIEDNPNSGTFHLYLAFLDRVSAIHQEFFGAVKEALIRQEKALELDSISILNTFNLQQQVAEEIDYLGQDRFSLPLHQDLETPF